MRPIMLPIILAMGVLAAACSDQVSSSPTSPSTAIFARAQAKGQNGVQVPFRGSFTATDQGVVVPPHLLVQGTGGGNATHLGRFTMTYSAVADLATPTATGTYRFTAANGDQLFTTFVGNAADTLEPGVISFTETLTIVGGNGRFIRAAGTFIVRRIAIVNFATVATPLNLEGEAGYAASKAAVESFTCIAARELAPFNITVNAVGPTPVLTDLIRTVPKQKMDALIERQAIRRMGEPRDVAHIIDFLISRDSDFVTGQTIYLGGNS